MSTFGYTLESVTVDPATGRPAPGVTVYGFTDPTGGTPVATVLSDLDGGFGFTGLDDTLSTLWVATSTTGERFPLVAREALDAKANTTDVAASLATKANAATVGALTTRVDTTETRVGTVENELVGRLSSASLNSTYAVKSVETSKLDKTEAAATYETQTSAAGRIAAEVTRSDAAYETPTGAQSKATTAATNAVTPVAARVTDLEDRGPFLIKAGADIPTPGQIAASLATYQALPFDGILFRSSAWSNDLFTTNAYTQATMQTYLQALPASMGTLSQNWIRLYISKPLPSWSDATAWANITTNLGNLAAAIANAGRAVVGIFLDTEWYGGDPTQNPWNYGSGSTVGTEWTYSDTTGATPGLQPVDARTLVRGRGKQIMDAIVAAWPKAQVLTTFGPWVSEAKTFTNMNTNGVPYPDVAFSNELMGSFIVGLHDSLATAPSAQVIDGGEFYRPRNRKQFDAVKAWQKTGFAESGTVLLNAADVAVYESNVSAGLGVYDKDQANAGSTHPAATLGALVGLAMQTADRYVWLYSEAFEWGAAGSGKPAVPADYKAAIARAKAQAYRLRRR